MELDFIKLKDIKPALAGYIKKSEIILKEAGIPDEKSVHDVRVLMKKSRAVLRLIAPQLDLEFSDREIKVMREAGRKMNAMRESVVLRKTLKDLKKKYPEIFLKLEGNTSLNEILKKTESVAKPSDQENSDIAQIAEGLNKAFYRVRFEPLNKLEPQLLLKELEMTYNRVINKYMFCRINPKRLAIHDLRKLSKDFLYQIWFFRPLNIPVIKSLEKKLDSITGNLGRYNDLSQLLRAIGYKYEYAANDPALDELVIIIRHEQDRYLSRVWPVAYKLFCPGNKLVNILGFKLLLI